MSLGNGDCPISGGGLGLNGIIVSFESQRSMLSNGSDLAKPPLLSPRAQNLLLIFACLLPVLAYQRSFSASFVYDDQLLILKNPNIHSLHNWTALFTKSMWTFIQNVDLIYYRPLTLLFFSLEYRLFGDQPMGWHLVSVLLHVIVTGLVFWTGKAVLKNRAAAVFAALLFGVYPINTEVACWAVAANESLLAVAVLAAFGAFVLWHEKARHHFGWLCLSLVCFASALLIKETAVILPPVVFWYALSRNHKESQWGRRIIQSAIDAIPYGLVMAIMLLIRSRIIHQSLASQIPVAELVTRFPALLLLDLRQLAWPFQLSVFYDPVPTLPLGPAIAFTVLVSAGVLMLLLWSCLRHPMFSLLLFWIVVSLLPPMLVVTPNEQLQDRFLYLPTIAVCWAAGWLVAWATSGPLRLRMCAFAGTGCVVAVFALASFITSGYWKNNLTLYERATEIAPRNVVALNSYAGELLLHGRYHQALAVLQRALALDPNRWMVLYQTGLAETALGDLPRAEEYFLRAENTIGRSATPEFVLTHRWRATVAIRQESWAKAEQLLREGLAVAPDNKQLRDGLAYCLENASRSNQVKAKVLDR